VRVDLDCREGDRGDRGWKRREPVSVGRGLGGFGGRVKDGEAAFCRPTLNSSRSPPSYPATASCFTARVSRSPGPLAVDAAALPSAAVGLLLSFCGERARLFHGARIVYGSLPSPAPPALSYAKSTSYSLPSLLLGLFLSHPLSLRLSCNMRQQLLSRTHFSFVYV